jgi:hypothetical protein
MNKSTEDGPALICIPDITGFTRFMAETNLEFSRKIIPPLLRSLVTANNLSLKVGEIEGDAILYYRFGELPPLQELIDQCKKFYLDFTNQLNALRNEFPDNFAKFYSSEKLSLKIILHAAEMTSTHIEGMIKLIGEDVVTVHKLLKNSIPEAEYIMLTEKLLSNYKESTVSEVLNWSEIKIGMDEYEYIGAVPYRYISLESLNEKVKGKTSALNGSLRMSKAGAAVSNPAAPRSQLKEPKQ